MNSSIDDKKTEVDDRNRITIWFTIILSTSIFLLLKEFIPELFMVQKSGFYAIIGSIGVLYVMIIYGISVGLVYLIKGEK